MSDSRACIDWNFVVEVLCKQLSHKYVGESHAIHVMSTTAVIVVMNLQIGLIQITLKN